MVNYLIVQKALAIVELIKYMVSLSKEMHPWQMVERVNGE